MVDVTEPTWACRGCLTAFCGPVPRPCERLCGTCRDERDGTFVAPLGEDSASSTKTTGARDDAA